MPHAIVLPLQRKNDAPLPAARGECTHAAFFRLLAEADADLAHRLHENVERKPFTLGLPEEERAHRPRPGDAARLRLTFLDDALFPLLAGALLTGGLRAGLEIGDAQFDVTGLLTTAGSHPQAGCARYVDLQAEATPAERLTLRFITPTAFRSQQRDVLWPEPRLLWQSWVRAWNANVGAYGPALDEGRLVGLAESGVQVERYALKTAHTALQEGGLSGFVGMCVYRLHGLSEPERRELTALANFAFYAGTGRKTAMGMGQTRCG